MLVDKVKRIANSIPWPIFSIALATIFGAITIYTEFVRDERPAIKFEILSDSSVLDVREDVIDLEIIYAGKDLRKSGQSLRVLVIRVSNVGSDDILKSFYDSSAPLGFSVDNGELVSVELENASEEYLKTQLSPSINGLSEVVFAPVILGANAYFSLRVLVIHTDALLPRISPAGKVARVSSISLVEAQLPEPETFWSETFSGTISIQLARLIPYTIATVTLLLLAISIPASISDALSKRNRKKNVGMFKRNSGHDFEPKDDVLFDNYIASGTFIIRQVESLLSEDFDLDELAERINRKPSMSIIEGESPDGLMAYDSVDGDRIYPRFVSQEEMQLFENGIIQEVDGHHRVSPHFEREL